MTTERIIARNVEWENCDEIHFYSVEFWLTEDIVRLIQLLDAELQRRYDEEQSIRKECHESFQTDLFDVGDEQDYSDSDPW